MKENGLSGVLSEEAMHRCFYGHLYQDGSFVASGELELSGDYEKTVQFQMRNIKKDAFYTVHLGLNNISGFVQWNYMTQDGYSALLTPRSITLICVGLISKAAARSSWVIPVFSRAALILAPIAQRSMQIPPFGTTNSFRNNYTREA